MKLTVVLERQEEGGYSIRAFLARMRFAGDTREKALRNIKEAIELYLEPDTSEILEYSGEKVKVAI